MIDEAFQAARERFPIWSSRPFEERRDILFRFWEQVASRRREIEEQISQENGKPLWESKGEIDAIESKITHSIESYFERAGRVERGGGLITRHRPHGIVAVFSPFNFPAHLPSSHMIPALLAGNCVLLKPSEQTPATARLLIECWHEAGLTNGEVALLEGGADMGRAIAAHRELDGLLFTGSAKTGHLIAQQLASHPEKLLALEMGGNSPIVVTFVEELLAAAYCIIQSAFITSGQRCTCARRLILLRSDANRELLSMVIEMARSLKVGPYTDVPEPFMGPLISEEAADRVIDYQERLQGTSLLTAKKSGAFVSPGMIELETTFDEECFGPLLQVIWVDTLEEAIYEANATQYGLAAALLSDHQLEWERFVETVRAGVINWNRATTGASGAAPFGGLGKSGNLRPTAYYAADQVAHPVASFEVDQVALPEKLMPGISI